MITIPGDIISLLLRPQEGSGDDMALLPEVGYLICTGQGIKSKATQ